MFCGFGRLGAGVAVGAASWGRGAGPARFSSGQRGGGGVASTLRSSCVVWGVLWGGQGVPGVGVCPEPPGAGWRRLGCPPVCNENGRAGVRHCVSRTGVTLSLTPKNM